MRNELMTSQSLVETAALDLQLPSGSVRAYRLGPPGAPAVLCVPGLDSNARSFDVVAGAVARQGRQVVVLDLRGRGAPGDWPRHLRLGEARGGRARGRDDARPRQLRSRRPLDGALVSMQAAVLSPERVRRLVAIDTVGPMDLLAMPSVATATLRLPCVYPSTGAYCAAMRASGILEPWEDLWKRAFAYELEGFLGFVRPRTSFRAVAEDLVYNLFHNATSLWPRLQLPTILVRATRRLPPFGFVVGARLRDAFLRTVASAELAEIDANHFEVMAHPDASRDQRVPGAARASGPGVRISGREGHRDLGRLTGTGAAHASASSVAVVHAVERVHLSGRQPVPSPSQGGPGGAHLRSPALSTRRDHFQASERRRSRCRPYADARVVRTLDHAQQQETHPRFEQDLRVRPDAEAPASGGQGELRVRGSAGGEACRHRCPLSSDSIQPPEEERVRPGGGAS